MKSYTKGAKRKAKKARKGLPGLKQPDLRKKRGGARMKEIERENLQSVLEARAIQIGKEKKDADQMRAQMLGEQAGQALYLLCNTATVLKLWGHYTALTAAEARYHRSLGKSAYPKTARIEAIRNAFETRDDDVIDLRTEEERDRDAVNRWMYWQGRIMCLDSNLQSAIYAAYRHHVTLVDCGNVTRAGKMFVRAMEMIDEYIS